MVIDVTDFFFSLITLFNRKNAWEWKWSFPVAFFDVEFNPIGQIALPRHNLEKISVKVQKDFNKRYSRWTDIVSHFERILLLLYLTYRLYWRCLIPISLIEFLCHSNMNPFITNVLNFWCDWFLVCSLGMLIMLFNTIHPLKRTCCDYD